MYYKECPYCGATLDPCEKCDCRGASAGYFKSITAYKKRLDKELARRF